MRGRQSLVSTTLAGWSALRMARSSMPTPAARFRVRARSAACWDREPPLRWSRNRSRPAMSRWVPERAQAGLSITIMARSRCLPPRAAYSGAADRTAWAAWLAATPARSPGRMRSGMSLDRLRSAVWLAGTWVRRHRSATLTGRPQAPRYLGFRAE